MKWNCWVALLLTHESCPESICLDQDHVIMFLSPLLPDDKSSATPTTYAKYVFNCFHPMYGHFKILRLFWHSLRDQSCNWNAFQVMPKKEIQWKKTSQNPQRTKTTPIEFTFTPPTGASQIFVRELQAAALTALPSHQLWAKNQAKTETSRKTHPNFSWVSFHFLTSPNPTDDLSFPS